MIAAILRKHIWLITFAAGAVQATADTNVAPVSSGFRATGVIDAQFFNRSNALAHTQSFTFTVSVVADRWEASVFWRNGSVNHYAGDGVTLLEWLTDPDFSSERKPAAIHNAAYPLDGYVGVLPWLTYASSAFLDSQPTVLPHPSIAARHSPQALTCRTLIERASLPPHLPARIVFIVDASRKRIALTNAYLQLEGLHKREKYERRKGLSELIDGDTSALYSVSTWTNVNGLQLPLNAMALIFPAGTTNRLVSRFTLVTTNIVATSTGLKWPDVKCGWSITDRRFRVLRQGIDCIQYNTNALMTGLDDVRLQKLFEQKKAAAPFLRIDELWEGAIWAVFAVVLVFPLIGWRLYLRQQSKRRYVVNHKQNKSASIC